MKVEMRLYSLLSKTVVFLMPQINSWSWSEGMKFADQSLKLDIFNSIFNRAHVYKSYMSFNSLLFFKSVN